MGKQEGLFRVAGNNWGLSCPFEPVVCRRGYCDFCEIYHDWQKRGEIIVICAWCSKVTDKKPNLGQPVVSHGICPECMEKNFGIAEVQAEAPEKGARSSVEEHFSDKEKVVGSNPTEPTKGTDK